MDGMLGDDAGFAISRPQPANDPGPSTDELHRCCARCCATCLVPRHPPRSSDFRRISSDFERSPDRPGPEVDHPSGTLGRHSRLRSA